MDRTIISTQANVMAFVSPADICPPVESTMHSNEQMAAPSKGNVIVLNKQPTVIQTPHSTLQSLQITNTLRNTGQENTVPSDDDIRKRRELLSRRPSYRKIFNDLAGTEMGCTSVESSGSDCDSNIDNNESPVGHSHSLSLPSVTTHYNTVIHSANLQLSSQCEGLPTISMSNSGNTTQGNIVHYAPQTGHFYLPVNENGSTSVGNTTLPEDQARKRELRLMKNREAARECRRKKKEYIKCLESRVAVLENQNKALIDELKSLKELYCQQKTEMIGELQNTGVIIPIHNTTRYAIKSEFQSIST